MVHRGYGRLLKLRPGGTLTENGPGGAKASAQFPFPEAASV